jgi:hypothetical protein
MILNAGKLALVPVFGPSTLLCSSDALSGLTVLPERTSIFSWEEADAIRADANWNT